MLERKTYMYIYVTRGEVVRKSEGLLRRGCRWRRRGEGGGCSSREVVREGRGWGCGKIRIGNALGSMVKAIISKTVLSRRALD